MPFDWWGAEFWERDASAFVRWGTLRHWAFVGMALGGAVALAARLPVIARRPRLEAFDLLALALGIPLFEIFANHWWGAYRHMLFLGLPAIVVTGGWALDTRIDSSVRTWTARAWFPLAAPWFVLQAALLYRDLALDRKLPFSETKMAVELLPEDAHVVSDNEAEVQSFLLWKPGITLRAPSGLGRHVRFTVLDNTWSLRAPARSIVVEECAIAPDRVYYVGVVVEPSCLTKLAHPHPRVIDRAKRIALRQLPNDEQFDIAKVDCGCLGGR